MNDIAFSVIINNDGIDDIIFKTIMVKGEKGDGGTGIDHIEKTSTVGNVDTYTVYLEDGSVAGTFTVTNAILPETATIEDVDIASFSDGADDVPVSELIVDIEPVQAGSGEPSPTNVRSISGFSTCKVKRTGINLWDENTELGAYNNYGEKINYNVLRNKNVIKVKGLSSIYFYCGTSNTTARVVFYTDNMTCISSTPATSLNNVITIPNNACFMAFNLDSSYGTTYNNDISINYPATDTAYHASNDDAWEIALGQTVYGGTLDVVSGVLTVTHRYAQVTTVNSPSSTGKTATVNISPRASGYTLDTNHFYCNMLKPSNYSTATDNHVHFANASIVAFYFENAIGTTVAEWETFLENNPLYLCYQLETPITTQLTPAQVRTLLNDNNIFADTGKIQKVTYFKTGCEALARLIDAFK